MKIQKLVGHDMNFEHTIWNEHCQVDLVNAAIYYVNYFIVKNYYDLLNGKKLFRVKATLKDRS